MNALDRDPIHDFIREFRSNPNQAAGLHQCVDLRLRDGRTIRGIASDASVLDLRAYSEGEKHRARAIDVITSLERKEFRSVLYAVISDYTIGMPLYRENWLDDSKEFTRQLTRIMQKADAVEYHGLSDFDRECPAPSTLFPERSEPDYVAAARG